MTPRHALLAALLLAAGASGGADYEPARPAAASEVLAPEQLKGPHHSVRPDVGLESFLQKFEIESDFGLFQVTSRSLFEKRVHEIQTLAKAVSMKDDSQYLSGVGQSLKQTVTAPVKIITDPIGSVKAIGSGVGKTIKRIGLLFRKREESEQEDTGLKQLVFGAEKRRLASELNLDVYTDNPKVQEFLDSVASGRGSGKLTISLATLAIPGGAGIAVGAAKYRGEVDDALRDLSPAELHARNRKQLLAMGIHEFVVKSFLDHPKLSPRHKTVITADLEGLGSVAERGSALEAAVEGVSDHVGGAQFYENVTGMLLALHKDKHPLTALEDVDGVVVARTADGGFVLALPVDYVPWTEETDEAFADFASIPATGKRVLVVSGKLSARARERLAAKGFGITEGFLTTR